MRFRSVTAFIMLLSITACNKIFEKPKWETDIKAPLIKTSLSIANIVRDTSLIKINPADSSVKIVSRQQIYTSNFTIDSFAQMQVKPYITNVKLSTLKLDSQTIVRPVTLGELAREMKKTGNPVGDIILNNQGNNVFFPGISNLTAGPIDVNIQQFFEDAVIQTGTMQVTLTNKLPVNITNLQFSLSNKVSNTVISSQTYTALNKNTSQTKTVNLAGKTVEGILALNVQDMDLATGGIIKIDTNNAIVIAIKVYGITVQSATAIFPAQNIVDDSSNIPIDGLAKDNIKLIKAKIRKGTVQATVSSTANDTVFFKYTLNGAKLNGQPFELNVTVLPNAVNKTFSANFDGYDLDLRGRKGDTINAIFNHIQGHIKYTGKKVHLDLNDSFSVVVKITELDPDYIEGYLGTKTIDLGAGSYNLDLFKSVESGTLNFANVNAKLVVENNMGLPANFVINNLTGYNTKTGSNKASAPLSGTIASAINGNPPIMVKSEKALDPNDAKNILNILPNKFTYSGSITYNSSVPVPLATDPASKFPNFAYRDNFLVPYVDIEIPLSVLAQDLVLADTVDFLSEKFQSSVKSGTFTVNVSNGFPLSGDLKMYFLDGGGSVLDSAISDGGILPAPVNAAGRVTSKTESKVPFFVDANRMQNILKAKRVVFKVKFTTTGLPSYVKIYSDYTVDFKLVGDFNYTVD